MSPAIAGPSTSKASPMWGVPMWASMSACERHASTVTNVPGTVADSKTSYA